MSDMTEENINGDKLPRFRSPPYPSMPLNKAIERAAALFGKALHHSVPLSVAGAAWEYRTKSSGLFATIAALKQFGLLIDEGAAERRRFKLTESAIRIVRDHNPASEKRKIAIQAAALSPKIHAELWERFGTAGASTEMEGTVRSYLTLDRVDDGAPPYSDLAAHELIAEYRTTLSYAGLLESNAPALRNTDALMIPIIEPNFGDITSPSTRVFNYPLLPPTEDEVLNDIRAEFFAGKVRIKALIDKDGLEQLQKKIEAFKILLS